MNCLKALILVLLELEVTIFGEDGGADEYEVKYGWTDLDSFKLNVYLMMGLFSEEPPAQ